MVGLVETDFGLGLVSEKVRDANGGLAPTLAALYARENGFSPLIEEGLARFFSELTDCNVIVGDMHAWNIVHGVDSRGVLTQRAYGNGPRPRLRPGLCLKITARRVHPAGDGALTGRFDGQVHLTPSSSGRYTLGRWGLFPHALALALSEQRIPSCPHAFPFRPR